MRVREEEEVGPAKAHISMETQRTWQVAGMEAGDGE